MYPTFSPSNFFRHFFCFATIGISWRPSDASYYGLMKTMALDFKGFLAWKRIYSCAEAKERENCEKSEKRGDRARERKIKIKSRRESEWERAGKRERESLDNGAWVFFLRMKLAWLKFENTIPSYGFKLKMINGNYPFSHCFWNTVNCILISNFTTIQ